ncbi:MAG: ATP-binding cassette domain-containing protein, partial [Candidatus Margulisbacteria bacterium]|nr:ATP-binding cassette domain-containing protein [Candidatus Margulisiibacteriota bacterium]
GIIAASILSGKALAPFDNAIRTWKSVLTARKSYKRLKMIEEKSPDRDEAMKLNDPVGKINVDTLFFTPMGSSIPIIKNISFEIEQGEMMGLIGPSASGKTTLVKLLVGIWKPSSGIIRLDGANIYTWNREQMGPRMGYLPQEIELFHGTVKDNIARMSIDPQPEEVIKAAKITHCHEMILSLPKGYDTEIGVRGAYLSAGQRQRIGLARTFYGDPRVIVLDEPNSHIDPVGDQALVRALDHAKINGVTVVIITHRPSILKMVDKVLVLAEGQLQHFGKRDDVLPHVLPQYYNVNKVIN